MRVTLTFDNGPDIKGTPAVLAALAERNIRAVFFFVGQKAHTHAHLVAQTSAAGHIIGNHTWSHSTPLGEVSQPGFARDEIEKTQRAIAPWASTPPLFRPVGAAPGAVIDHRLLNLEALQTLNEGGYTVVLWNVVPRDWERPQDWLDGSIQACREVDHAVVVLHDGYPDGMDLLPAFLDALRDEGAEFSTEFPESCTPILSGVATLTATPITTAAGSQRATIPRVTPRLSSLKEPL